MAPITLDKHKLRAVDDILYKVDNLNARVLSVENKDNLQRTREVKTDRSHDSLHNDIQTMAHKVSESLRKCGIDDEFE
jgi:hypothetical protein